MPERIDERTPGRRLWDRIKGSEVSDGSRYFDRANPAEKAAFERVGREIEGELAIAHARAAEKHLQLQRLRAIIDRPDPHDFIEASVKEAAFQMYLWGTTEGFPTAFDGQDDHHFVYLVGYLVGKVAATSDDDLEKKLHRITTIAAAVANWHIVVTGRAALDAARPARSAEPAGREAVSADDLGEAIG